MFCQLDLDSYPRQYGSITLPSFFVPAHVVADPDPPWSRIFRVLGSVSADEEKKNGLICIVYKTLKNEQSSHISGSACISKPWIRIRIK